MLKTAALALTILATSLPCALANGQGPALDPRIGPTDRQRFAALWEKEWRNPRVLVDLDATYLLVGGKPLRGGDRPVKDLAAALAKLPRKSWPYGRIVHLAPSPRVSRALDEGPGPEAPARVALDRARRAVTSLGVEIIETPVGCDCGGHGG